MLLPTWLAKRHRARSSSAWVGVQMHAQHVLAARVTPPAAGGRPRVHSCHRDRASGGLPSLRAWWDRCATPRDAGALLLGASEYQILQIDAPAVEPAEYRNAARWSLKDLIDFPVEDAALDCLRLPTNEVGGPSTKLITVVSQKSLVLDAVTQWRSSGLALKVIDIPEMALRNVAALATGGNACAFIHIGVDSAHLIVMWQQELCVSRQLGMGGEQLRVLDEPSRHAQIERLALEIQRTADAFSRQFSATTLTQLWVSSVFDAASVANLLSQQLSIEVLTFVPTDWIDFDAGAQAFDLSRRIDHTLAIGAALRDEVAA